MSTRKRPRTDQLGAGFALRSARVLSRMAWAASLIGSLTLAAQAQITKQNWGTVTSPVYNSSETVSGGAYSSAELFAGPNKLG
ncbi:MAG TPA: hypothetical protein VMU05_23860, partial [Dongiaceae bacterium]|nr:hypothetical protein [Dongiaceae bacterium]